MLAAKLLGSQCLALLRCDTTAGPVTLTQVHQTMIGQSRKACMICMQRRSVQRTSRSQIQSGPQPPSRNVSKAHSVSLPDEPPPLAPGLAVSLLRGRKGIFGYVGCVAEASVWNSPTNFKLGLPQASEETHP